MNKLLTALLAGLFFSGVSIAAEAPSFETLDQDGDGSISAQEAESSPELMEAWNDVDANEDGMLDRAEFSAFETMATEEKEY